MLVSHGLRRRNINNLFYKYSCWKWEMMAEGKKRNRKFWIKNWLRSGWKRRMKIAKFQVMWIRYVTLSELAHKSQRLLLPMFNKSLFKARPLGRAAYCIQLCNFLTYNHFSRLLQLIWHHDIMTNHLYLNYYRKVPQGRNHF